MQGSVTPPKGLGRWCRDASPTGCEPFTGSGYRKGFSGAYSSHSSPGTSPLIEAGLWLLCVCVGGVGGWVYFLFLSWECLPAPTFRKPFPSNLLLSEASSLLHFHWNIIPLASSPSTHVAGPCVLVKKGQATNTAIVSKLQHFSGLPQQRFISCSHHDPGTQKSSSSSLSIPEGVWWAREGSGAGDAIWPSS